MKLCLVTCLWGRHELSRIVLSYYRDLAWTLPHVGVSSLDVVAAGSEGLYSMEVARDAGAVYVEAPNNPLGRKWNAALASARMFSPDAVLIVGSDDLVAPSLLALYSRLLAAGHTYMGCTDLYLFDTVGRRLLHWNGYRTGHRRGEPVGAGRLISREVLDRLDWRLWDDERETGLDGSMTHRLNASGVRLGKASVRLADGGLSVLAVKSGVNMWSVENLARTGDIKAVPDAQNFLRHHYGDETTEKLMRL